MYGCAPELDRTAIQSFTRPRGLSLLSFVTRDIYPVVLRTPSHTVNYAFREGRSSHVRSLWRLYPVGSCVPDYLRPVYLAGPVWCDRNYLHNHARVLISQADIPRIISEGLSLTAPLHFEARVLGDKRRHTVLDHSVFHIIIPMTDATHL